MTFMVMELLHQDTEMRDDLSVLSVLDTLAEREQITQRVLAQHTGLNLKKVNYCLHQLLDKGYIKFQRVLDNPDKRGYLYVLTPSGVTAKSKLTYRFLKYSLSFYNQVENKFQRCLQEMKRVGVQRIVLFGVSDVVRVVVDQTNGQGVSVVGIVDKAYAQGNYNGLKVWHGIAEIEADWDGLLVTDLAEWDEVNRRLAALDLPERKIWHLS